jgi:hypothetical protein
MTFVSTVFCCVACKVHLSCAPNRIVNAAKIATRVRRINVDVHGSDEWASAPVRSASGHGAVAHPALVAAVGLKFQNVPNIRAASGRRTELDYWR